MGSWCRGMPRHQLNGPDPNEFPDLWLHNLEILYRFEDHDGFDGVMLGHAGAPYHFEFTKAHGHTVGRAPTRDNLLVFCLPDPGEWQVAVERMEGAGFRAVPAFNPYWDRSGRTFEDPDGYRVVIQRADWNA